MRARKILWVVRAVSDIELRIVVAYTRSVEVETLHLAVVERSRHARSAARLASNVSNHRQSSNDHHNHPGVPPPRKAVLRAHCVMLIVRFLLVNGTYEGLLRIS